MVPGWTDRLLRGREHEIAEPLAAIGDTLLRGEAMSWAGKEALIVVCVSFGLGLIGWMGSYLADPEPAVLAASFVLLLYLVHVIAKLPQTMLATWLFLRLGLSPRRLGRIIIHRAVLFGLRQVERAAAEAIASSSWYIRLPVGFLARLTAEPDNRIAWRIAEASLPFLARHVLRGAALGLVPIFLVIVTFRMFVTNRLLLSHAAHLGFVEVLLYPFAMIVDLVAGTSLRAALKGA